MEPRRIAVLIKHLSVGGRQKVLVQLANGFARKGQKVDLVVVKNKGPLASEVASGVRVVELDSHRMWWGLPNLMGYLKRSRPDVLLAAGWQVNLIATWAKLLSFAQVRLVLSVHVNVTQQSRNTDIWWAPFNPLAVKIFYPAADAISVVSEGILEDLSEISGLAAGNARVIYNPVVDQNLLMKSEDEVSHPWFAQDNDTPVILGVGRLGFQKNFSLLLRAFARVRRNRETRLVILGDGGDREKLEELARELNIQCSVDFVGFVENPYRFMANASLLVLSSRFEGLGNVLVEALACGCPVVSTDCPSGPREILEDGKWGRLVPVGDEEALAEAIQKSLSEEHDQECLRQRAMDFSVDQAVDKYLDVLLSET